MICAQFPRLLRLLSVLLAASIGPPRPRCSDRADPRRRPPRSRPIPAQAARDRRREVHALPAPGRQVGRLQLRGARRRGGGPRGRKDQIFGAVEMTAVTEVAKVSRTVHFRDVKIVKAVFPTGPGQERRLPAGAAVHGVERPVDHVARPARDLAGHQRRGEEGARRPCQERPAALRLHSVGRDPGSDRRRPGLASSRRARRSSASSTPARSWRWMMRADASTSTSSTASWRRPPSRGRGRPPAACRRPSLRSKPSWPSRTSSTR